MSVGVALYQLAGEYQHQFYQLAELDLPDEVVTDTLEAMEGELQHKAGNVAMFLRQLEHTAEGIKAAEAAMKARREAIEGRHASISAYLLHHLQACGIKKVEHPMIAITVKANPARVDVFDAAQIPAAYMTRPEPLPPPPALPDKKAIKAAIDAGTEVPGAKLTRGARLDIK